MKRPSKCSNLSANIAANRVGVIRPGQGVIDNDPEQASFVSAPSRLILKSIVGIRDLDGKISIREVPRFSPNG